MHWRLCPAASARSCATSAACAAGRASQRLQEMAGLPSSTIHRLLQYKPAGSRSRIEAPGDDEEELEGSYSFCRSNPLPAEAVLVDEAAMLDVNLAAALLEALPPNCQLVLVGGPLFSPREMARMHLKLRLQSPDCSSLPPHPRCDSRSDSASSRCLLPVKVTWISCPLSARARCCLLPSSRGSSP